MALEEPFAVAVTDLSGVADARRHATALAASLGFDETDVGRVAIVVTEAATNLVKHATGGEILGRAAGTAKCAALEMLALDRGPGIESVAAALRDGFSSAGSAGTGLGAIQAAARAFMASLIPTGREASLFGFYALCGKAAAVMGPVIFGTASLLTGGNQRIAILSVGLMFVAGLVLLARVPAGGPAPARA